MRLAAGPRPRSGKSDRVPVGTPSQCGGEVLFRRGAEMLLEPPHHFGIGSTFCSI